MRIIGCFNKWKKNRNCGDGDAWLAPLVEGVLDLGVESSSPTFGVEIS